MNSRSKHITHITFHEKRFRFKCQRYATFCCKLGGPRLTIKDVERIKKAGYNIENFLEPFDSESNNTSIIRGSLKNRENGSCIFLKFQADQNHYACSIYDFRPALCRLYPFDFETEDSNTIILKYIPCCRGLNAPDGKLIDERFITDHLLPPLLETLRFIRTSNKQA